MIIFIAIFSLIFLILALKRLEWAVLLTIAALPAYLLRFSFGGIPSTLLEVMILIVFAVWFLKVGKPWKNFQNFRKQKLYRLNYPFYREIVLFLFIAYAAIFTAHLSSSALGIFKAYFFEPILFFIVVINLSKSQNDYKKIFWALSFSALAVSLVAIFQEFTGQFIANPFWAAAATRRVVSVFGYPNAVGLYLAPLILIMAGLFFSLDPKKTKEKIFLALTIILSLLAIIFAHSVGALIGLFVATWLALIIYNKKTRIFILVLTVLAGIILISAPKIREPIIAKVTFQDLSGKIRERQWTETLMMLKNGKILSGAGLSSYQAAVKPYHQEGIFFNADKLANFDAQLRNSAALRAKYWQPVEIYMYPHNIFLNFWSELGLLGALLFSFIIIKYLYLSLFVFRNSQSQEIKIITLVLAGAMITIIVHGLVDVPYFKNDLAVMFWLLIAVLGIINFNITPTKENYENDPTKINR